MYTVVYTQRMLVSFPDPTSKEEMGLVNFGRILGLRACGGVIGMCFGIPLSSQIALGLPSELDTRHSSVG